MRASDKMSEIPEKRFSYVQRMERNKMITTITELIKRLREIKTEYGDLPVVVGDIKSGEFSVKVSCEPKDLCIEDYPDKTEFESYCCIFENS